MNSLKLFARKHKNKKGFTLVELVIVIAVLAIIAAIAIPSVIGVVKNANAATDASNAQALTATIKTFIAENEAKVTHPLTGKRGELVGDSTAQDLLRAYGVDGKGGANKANAVPDVKSGVGKFCWDIDKQVVIITTATAKILDLSVDATSLTAMGIL